MSVRQTSLKAFQDIQYKLSGNRLKVYECLKNFGSANNSMIARRLTWSINRITPRIKELRDAGLVKEDCIRPCPINKTMTIWWRVA